MTTLDADGKNGMGWQPPTNFVQWKGTDVCVDLHCTCGRSPHFDGYFLYAWRCACGLVWKMDDRVEMTEMPPEEAATFGAVQDLSDPSFWDDEVTAE